MFEPDFKVCKHGLREGCAVCPKCEAEKKPVKYEEDVDAFPFPEPKRARKTDPNESHTGVERIVESVPENRAKILALDFGTGLNYRQIAEQTGIYPTSCSRIITTMVRENSLVVAYTTKRIAYYLPTSQMGQAA